MKRRHYRIHYTDHSLPMRRVKHREIPWLNIIIALAALLIIGAAVFLVVKWLSSGGEAFAASASIIRKGLSAI